LSAPGSDDPDYESLAPWIRRVLETVLHDPALTLVNVNFPRAPRGLTWTRVSVRRYDGRVVPMKDPMGRELYWFTVVPLEGWERGTDRWALERGWVSLTPLRLDLTDEDALYRARARHPLDEEAAAKLPPREPPSEAARVVREDEAPSTAPTAAADPAPADKVLS